MYILDVETLHSEPIVCCSAPNAQHIFVSGCEGGIVCFNAFDSQKAIGSINFGPNDVCTSIKSSQKDSWSFFCGIGTVVHAIDIRKGYQTGAIYKTFRCGCDEINAISLNASESWLAAADDGGEIYCFRLGKEDGLDDSREHVNDRKPDRVLRRGHQNICSSVMFSKIDDTQLISAGLDCRMIRWNVPKLKISKLWTMPHIATARQQALNPPLIHCIDTCLLEDGKKELVAVARGDGSVAIYDAASRNTQKMTTSKKVTATNEIANPDSLIWMSFLEDGCHNSACNAVSFSSPSNIARHLLLSGGNDMYIKLWDWTQDKSLVHNVLHTAKVNCLVGLNGQQPSNALGIMGDVNGNVRVVSEQP